MSTVIKPGAGANVRPFPGPPTPPAIAVEDPRDIEHARLLDVLERTRQRAVDAEQASAAAVIEARREGRLQGAAEADAREEERLACLAAGIEQARGDLTRRLDALDGLAAQIARAALDKLFDEPAEMQERVAAMLARRMRDLKRASVVSVAVSPDDFSDSEQLEAVRRRAVGESAAVGIALDPELGSGTCRIACKLGQVDLDLSGQWREIASLLDAMSAEAGA